MTVHTIPVKLIARRGRSPYLEVDVPDGITRIKRMSRPQTIHWHLEHHGSSGHFNRLNDAISPGFLWISPPFPGIFGRPRVTDHGQSIVMDDQYNLEEKIGTWYYRLSATIDGVVYRTLFKSPYPAHVRLPRSSHMRAATSSSSTVFALAAGATTALAPNVATNPTIKNR